MKRKNIYQISIVYFVCTLIAINIQAQPSAFGSGFDVQEFYKPFSLEDITPEKMQSWPYYKYASAHWDEYSIHGTSKIERSSNPAKLVPGEQLDMNSEFRDGQTWIESFLATQVKGFVVMKDNQILAEFYDNGFNLEETNLLQSASKTFTGVAIHQLIDEGLLDPDATIASYLKDFKDSDVGSATVQQVLDMLSGLPNLLDFHTPGAPGQVWEIEIGLQPGDPKGHRNAIRTNKAVAKPGEQWNYSDMNTDLLGLVAEEVSGKKFSELLTGLLDAFGANYEGSIALTSDGSSSPNYGISLTARDYALFHQWIAQGKAPKSYYASVMDPSKTKFSENEVAQLLGGGITYGSQSYYLKEQDVIYSSGSYGELGYSDMETGVSVVFLQDWAVNTEIDKYFVTRERAIAIIDHLRLYSDPRKKRSRF
jgi:CubicO group peptidase (beta-lactamase class C family)